MGKKTEEKKDEGDIEAICRSEDIEVRDKVKYRNKRRRLCLFVWIFKTKEKKSPPGRGRASGEMDFG